MRHLIRLLTFAPSTISTALQQPQIRHPIAIGLGAIAGALSRYYLTIWLANRLGTAFPSGTFLINLSGCLGMGFFTTYAERVAAISPELRLLIAVGFLGSYTTFSTYELDTQKLIQQSDLTVALFYWAGSAILGVIGIQMGTILARLLFR